MTRVKYNYIDQNSFGMTKLQWATMLHRLWHFSATYYLELYNDVTIIENVPFYVAKSYYVLWCPNNLFNFH